MTTHYSRNCGYIKVGDDILTDPEEVNTADVACPSCLDSGIEDIAEEQGWNDSTLAQLLIEWVDDYADKSKLMRFLWAKAIEENNPSELHHTGKHEMEAEAEEFAHNKLRKKED